MKTDFSVARFVCPVGTELTYGDHFYCFGILLSLNSYENCLFTPVKIENLAGQEGVGNCFYSFPVFENWKSIFGIISSMGGNTFSNAIDIIDLPKRFVDDEFKEFGNGYLDTNLSVLNFRASLIFENCVLDLKIEPSGFIKISNRLEL